MVRSFRLFTFGAVLCAFALPAVGQYGTPYCQLLDRIEEPVSYLYVGYVSRTKIEEAGETGLMEFGGGAGLFYYRTGLGDFDLRAAFDTFTFTDSADLRLPTTLAVAKLDMKYILRFENGYALRVGAKPGLYSEIFHVNGDHLFIPFSIHGIRAINPNLSLMVGLDIYPGFDRAVDPRIGARWSLSDILLLDFFYPTSEIVIRPNMNWAVRVGVAFNEQLEYQLSSDDDRQRLIWDETRMFVGVDRRLQHDQHLFIQIGRVVNRKFSFRRNETGRDLDDAHYVRIGIGSYF